MTIFDQLAIDGRHRNLVLSVVVDGIPYVLIEREVPAASLHPSSTGRTQVACLTAVREGETSLDRSTRLEVAPTLDTELVDPDGTLAALFAVASPRASWLASSMVSTSSTSVTLFDATEAARFDDGQHVYIEDETITLGTLSVLTFGSCTRAAFGSTAAIHEAVDGPGANEGASIYDVPPTWVGRRAKLVGYLMHANGDVVASGVLGAFVVDESPRHLGDFRWGLRLAGAMQDFLTRSVGFGLREARQTASPTRTADTITIPVYDALAFRLGTDVDVFAVAEGLTNADGAPPPILKVTDLDTSPHSVTLQAPAGRFGTWGVGVTDGPFALRPLVVVGGPSPLPLLWALISDEGQGASTHDRLPGRKTSDLGDPGWRFGAGIAPALVDVAAIEALTGLANTSLIIDGERPLGEMLTEWATLNDAIVVTTSDGLLTVRRLTDRTSSPMTLTAAAIIPGSIVVEVDEGSITPIIAIEANYSPQDGETQPSGTAVDVEMARRYPRGLRTETIELRSIAVVEALNRTGDIVVSSTSPRWTHPSTMPMGELVTALVDVMRGEANGVRRIVRITTTMATLGLRIGDVVTLDIGEDDYSQAPDMRGGALDGESGRVVSRRPDYDRETVALTIELIEPLTHVLPAAVIASGAAAVMTLSTTGDEVASTTPEQDFYVGARVAVVDRSQVDTDDSLAVEVFTVLAIQSAPPRLTLSGTPTFAIEAGVDYLCLYPDVAGTTGSGFANTEMCTLHVAGTSTSEDGDRFG